MISNLIFMIALVGATPNYGNVQVSEVVSIYDGDTFTVNIDHWPDIVGKRISVRIRGIDTPELTEKRVRLRELARASKQEVVAILRSAKVVELRNMSRDKYFRIDADVFADDIDLGQHLINKRMAKQYDGNKKIKWMDKDYQNWKSP
jgi:micrococcal nuclease